VVVVGIVVVEVAAGFFVETESSSLSGAEITPAQIRQVALEDAG
jgi:hypothetical protein